MLIRLEPRINRTFKMFYQAHTNSVSPMFSADGVRPWKDCDGVREGGYYNLDSIAKSSLACVQVLLQDKPIQGSSELPSIPI